MFLQGKVVNKNFVFVGNDKNGSKLSDSTLTLLKSDLSADNNGNQGNDGPLGLVGPDGSAPDGLKGMQGSQGPRGSQGIQGSRGVIGPTNYNSPVAARIKMTETTITAGSLLQLLSIGDEYPSDAVTIASNKITVKYSGTYILSIEINTTSAIVADILLNNVTYVTIKKISSTNASTFYSPYMIKLVSGDVISVVNDSSSISIASGNIYFYGVD